MSESSTLPTVHVESETPSAFPQRVTVRTHSFRADVGPSSGSTDSAPGPHDYFDASLASCKALTAMWFARQRHIALERVDVRVERDDRDERTGTYRLRVHVAFFGETLTDDDRAKLHAAVARCPIHKLMTTTDVEIETVSASSS